MPIYEFYCESCHRLYNFFSSGIDTETRPACPRCGRGELERRPARFATISRSGGGDEGEEEGGDPFAGLDEERLERAFESMGSELETMGEGDDPRQMAHFFRRFGEAAGMKLGPRMEEMLHRLERGEDPDSLEEEMGGDLDDEDGLEEWFQLKEAAGRRRKSKRPPVDDTLYFM